MLIVKKILMYAVKTIPVLRLVRKLRGKMYVSLLTFACYLNNPEASQQGHTTTVTQESFL